MLSVYTRTPRGVEDTAVDLTEGWRGQTEEGQQRKRYAPNTENIDNMCIRIKKKPGGGGGEGGAGPN